MKENWLEVRDCMHAYITLHYNTIQYKRLVYFNPLEAEARLNKHPVRTSKKTQTVTITKINWLTLLIEIIDIYF
jgi:hypothetical protein